MLDLLLVRHGPWFGGLLAFAVALLSGLVARALARRSRRAALAQLLGAAEPLDDRAVGREVVLEGVLEGDALLQGFEGGPPCVASSARTAQAAEVVASRGRGARLRVGTRLVTLEGALEVVEGQRQAALSHAQRAAALGEGAEQPIESTPLVAHTVSAGDHVRVVGRLARAESDYRGGGLALVADEGGSLRVAALAPRGALGVRGPLASAALGLAISLVLLQAAAHGASRAAAARYADGSRGDALPLSTSHRVALVAFDRREALALFEEIAERDRPTHDSLLLASEALEVRGRCAAAVELLGVHGELEEARARAEHCASPWVAHAMIAIERADGRSDAALAWADRAAALASARDAPNQVLWQTVAVQLLVESGRYEEAAAHLERAAPSGALSGAHAFECLTGALRASAGHDVALPTEATPTCGLARREIGATPASEWLDHGDPIAPWAALAAPGTERMGRWLVIDGVFPSDALQGRLPRWDGLAREALAGAMRRDDPNVRGARCALAEAEALHALRRTGHAAEPPEGCSFESLRALAAVLGGQPVEPSLGQDLPERVSNFRRAPSLETLRALERLTVPELAYGHRISEEESRARERRIAERPASPVERAASGGDARPLERLLGARLAVHAGSSHREEALAWFARRRRELGHPWVPLPRLREEAYDDLWIARELDDDVAEAAARARLDRLSAQLEDRRRVVLLEILRLAAQ